MQKILFCVIFGEQVFSIKTTMGQQSLLYLWKKRTLFLGYVSDPISLSQGAASLHLSLGEPFYVKKLSNNRTYQCTSVLVPPGCSLLIDACRQPVVNLNLDVMGEDYFHLHAGMQNRDAELSFGLKGESRFRQELSALLSDPQDSSSACRKLDALLQQNDGLIYKSDQRVKTVVDLIQSEIGTNLSVDYLAQQVNLSVAGLTKLFKKQTGVPIRRYRQWHRLYVTATEIGKGKTLTDAAQSAGFVDLSHCIHTFNLMLGMKPSYYLQRPEEITIITEGSSGFRCGRV